MLIVGGRDFITVTSTCRSEGKGWKTILPTYICKINVSHCSLCNSSAYKYAARSISKAYFKL